MNPSTSDLEYGKEQIGEANRRLSELKKRVSVENEYFLAHVVEEEEEEKSTVRYSKENPEIEEMIEEEFGEIIEIETDVKLEVDQDLISSHLQNVIIDCQLCIELAAKSLFKLAGQDYPFSHGITLSDGRTQDFYTSIPDEFEEKEKIVRVIFTTQFWDHFYELAKYGSPQLNVRPEMIFTVNDCNRAIDDAEYCINVAESMLDYVEDLE